METDKIIIIKNCTQTELQAILEDWCALYPPKSRVRTIFEIAEMGANTLVLKVDKRIDDTRFFFLVNYCAYPIGSQKTFEAVGYIDAVKALQGRKAYVFNDESDPDHDNVWLITEDNETYKFDFGKTDKRVATDNGGKHIRIATENKYKELDANRLPQKYEKFVVRTESNSNKGREKAREEKRKRRLEKRFPIISRILLVGIPVFFLIHTLFSLFDTFYLVFSSSGLIAWWFIGDYKIFNDAKRTWICVAISLLCVGFGLYVDSEMLELSAVPLASVIVMWIVNRFIINQFSLKINSDLMITNIVSLRTMLLLFISALLSIGVLAPFIRGLGFG